MILNLWAIIPIALIVLSFTGLEYFFPTLTHGIYGDLAISIVSVIIGAITEAFGIRGRVLFMPIWLLGIIMVSIQLFVLWGWFGLVAPVLLAIAGFFWLLKKARIDEQKKWKEAKELLHEFNNHEKIKDDCSFWKHVNSCLYLPGLNKLSEEICAHNLVVVEAALAVLSDSTDTTDKSTWEKLRSFYSDWPNQESKPTLENEDEEIIRNYLKNKTEEGDSALA